MRGHTEIVQSTRRIQRGTVMRQQVQGEEEFLDEVQSRDCVKSCTLGSLLCS